MKYLVLIISANAIKAARKLLYIWLAEIFCALKFKSRVVWASSMRIGWLLSSVAHRVVESIHLCAVLH